MTNEISILYKPRGEVAQVVPVPAPATPPPPAAGGSAYFQRPYRTVLARAIGDSIKEATSFVVVKTGTDMFSEGLVLVDGADRREVTLEGTVSAAGITAQLTGKDADKFTLTKV